MLVQKAYGNEALNRSNVFKWYSRFRDGRGLVEDDKRSGHREWIRTEVNFAAVADLVKNDRRIASRMIAESFNIQKIVVLLILKEDLRKRKLYTRFVPNTLRPAKGKLESHLAKTLSRGPIETNIILTTLLREMRPGVLPMTPK